MAVHALYDDFFLFLDRVASSQEDPWALYEACYLDPHRPILTAWWEQCLGFPLETWQARVRDVRPTEYGLLRALVRESDPQALAAQALASCEQRLPLEPAPEVYLLVGFFSPDAFVLQVQGDWVIGVGLERFLEWSRLPLLIAHEYAHCFRRRRFPVPATLGERLVDEGLAAHFSRLVFPEVQLYHHLLMARGEFNSLLAYEPELLEAVEPHLGSTDPEILKRFLFGRMKGQPARAGCFLGYRLVERAMRQRNLSLLEALAAPALPT